MLHASLRPAAGRGAPRGGHNGGTAPLGDVFRHPTLRRSSGGRPTSVRSATAGYGLCRCKRRRRVLRTDSAYDTVLRWRWLLPRQPLLGWDRRVLRRVREHHGSSAVRDLDQEARQVHAAVSYGEAALRCWLHLQSTASSLVTEWAATGGSSRRCKGTSISASARRPCAVR
jgi:hypothetical protein